MGLMISYWSRLVSSIDDCIASASVGTLFKGLNRGCD